MIVPPSDGTKSSEFLDDRLYERLKARLPDSDRSQIVNALSNRLQNLKLDVKRQRLVNLNRNLMHPRISNYRNVPVVKTTT
jgi:hypothetical protein